MTESSARLALPYLQPNQAQKHVTHNEALGRLDILVQLTLEALGAVTPPVSPAEGAVWGLGAAPTGAWAGQAGALAAWVDGGWLFFVPQTGWRAWAKAEGGLYVHTGGVWTAVGGSGSGPVDLENVPGVGINTTSDPVNRLAVASAATLLTHAGAGHQVKVNKAAAGDTASLLYQTGFSGRAEMGLAGNDDFSVKVSPDGSAFAEAIRIDRTSGRVELPQPVVLPALSAAPTPPPAGKLALYARSRAGAAWIDVQRPSGRDFPLQPHFGVNRIATWAPSISTTVTTHGVSRTVVGTASTPTLTTTNLASSIRRWRMTSGTTVNSVADERVASWVCWRGNAAGLGGFSYVNRFSMTTLQPTGTAIFGLTGSAAALATTQTLVTMTNIIGIGFDRGTHTNWQIAHNDGSGAPTLIDLGASFPAASLSNVLTLYIAAAPNAAEVGVRVVEEVSGAVAEIMLTTDLPAATQFLSPRNFLSNGATAAAVAYDCSGLYVESDY